MHGLYSDLWVVVWEIPLYVSWLSTSLALNCFLSHEGLPMHIIIPLALGLLVQEFPWGFMVFVVVMDLLANDCHLVTHVIIFCLYLMQSAILHAVL